VGAGNSQHGFHRWNGRASGLQQFSSSHFEPTAAARRFLSMTFHRT
jgi:hypothetical protein